MSMRVEGDGKRRVITDDMNPRIYHEEIRCEKCREYYSSEEISYFKDGERSQENDATPRCENCEYTVIVAECDNCGMRWAENELVVIKDYFQRVEPGGTVPSGECPSCGALCYPWIKEKKNGK